MSRTILAAYVQHPVSLDIATNEAVLKRLIDRCPDNSLVVTPEGAISGYAPQSDFLARIDHAALDGAIERLHAHAAKRGQLLLLGACVRRDGLWRNATFVCEPNGARGEYWKVNLAHLERRDFTPGDALPIWDVSLGGVAFKLAVQMCREIRHPEQWRHLAANGAEVFGFLNNAIGDARVAPVWRSHLISRAAETQRFIVGANAAASEQNCPSILIAPDGAVLHETMSPGETFAIAELDLTKVSTWVLDQSRRDLNFDF
ncbi:MAG: carbon-nitrogen hydrolase family protein [Hyphomonadaceae bacterium]